MGSSNLLKKQMDQHRVIENFIVTRFNVYNEDWNRKGTVHVDDRWLNYRFYLFQEYCLPSIMNQEYQNFTWLVYFDLNTPEKYKKIIEKIEYKFSKFLPIYVRSNSQMKSEMRSDILKLVLSKENLVSITRIDSDDMLQKNALILLKSKLECKIGTIYNFQNIVCFDLQKKIFTSYKDFSGPFLTLITSLKKTEFNSIFDYNHHDWPDKYKMYQIENCFDAIQIIHGGNLVNGLKGKFLWDFSLNSVTINFKFYHKIFQVFWFCMYKFKTSTKLKKLRVVFEII